MAAGDNLISIIEWLRHESEFNARAKRVLCLGFDGVDYNILAVNADGSINANFATGSITIADPVTFISDAATPSSPSLSCASFNMVWDPSSSMWARARSAPTGAAPIASVDHATLPVCALYGWDGTQFATFHLNAANTDTINPSSNKLMETLGYPFCYNEVTDRWERQRSCNGQFLGIDNTGIPASTTFLWKTGSFWTAQADGAAGDNLTEGVAASALYQFDGTNFDRCRGDTTNGLDVDVTRVSGTVTVAGTVATSGMSLTATTAAETSVSVLTSNTTVLAASASRKRAWIQNTGSSYVRLKLGATATTGSAIRLVPQVGTYVIEPTASGHIYQGIIDGIAETATSTVVVVQET